jgi:hypothetical protein
VASSLCVQEKLTNQNHECFRQKAANKLDQKREERIIGKQIEEVPKTNGQIRNFPTNCADKLSALSPTKDVSQQPTNN